METIKSTSNTPEKLSDPKKLYQLFLVDDHCIIREGLRALIERQKDLAVAGEANRGQVAYQKISKLQPDLVIMDISMKGWNGAQTTERIKKEWPHIKVLIFSMHQEPAYLRELFQVGASGYLLKSSLSAEVLKAIRITLSGGTYLDPKLGENLLDLLRRPENPPASRGSALSQREQLVLKQCALGYANKEIAAQLGISIKTVETHKGRGMNKLSLNSRVDLTRYALDQGWLVATEAKCSPEATLSQQYCSLG